MKEVPLLEFYQKYLTPQRFPSLVNMQRSLEFFLGVYVCKQLFSKMKNVKSKLRTRLKDNHLDSVLRLATSSLQPEIETLSKVGQQQPSH